MSVNLDNKTFNKESEPRMKGNAVKDNDTSTEIEKEYLHHVKREMDVLHGNCQQKDTS